MGFDIDDRLLSRYRDGDVDAFDELVERYKTDMFAYLCAATGSRHDAEDLFQETFLRVIASLPRYRPEGKFRRWLFRVARNLVLDRHRREKKRRTVSLDKTGSGNGGSSNTVVEPVDGRPDPRRMAAASEIGHRIDDAVALLPPVQREVFVMRHRAGLRFREIADIQQCPLPTVLGRMRYALKKLRAELGEVKEFYSEVP